MNASISANPTRNIWHVSGKIFCLALFLLIVVAGFRLQIWVWNHTESLHYRPDQSNAMRWAATCENVGYLNVYDNVASQHVDKKYELDYPPLRLGVIAVWGHWLRTRYPAVTQPDPDFMVNWPFIRFNSLMHLMASVLVFLLVRMWHQSKSIMWSKWILPGIAATWLWLNPTIWIDAYMRPASDVWVVPFYLLAVWLACLDGWLLAGAALGIGAMFKGQQLIMLPLFILWPLMRGGVLHILRMLIGFAVATAIVVSPWMITRMIGEFPDWHRAVDWPAATWIATSMAIAICIVATRSRFRLTTHGRFAEALLLVIALSWPAIKEWNVPLIITLAASAVMVALFLRLLPSGAIGPTLAALLATMLFLCIPLFHGSTAWYEVAFRYGAEKFPNLEVGDSDCLAGILRKSFHWASDDIAMTIPARAMCFWPKSAFPITLEQLLGGLVFVGMGASALAMMLQQRRKSPRFLIAMSAPWLIYFALGPKMHERYLIWGASVTCCACAIDVGMAGLSVLLSLSSSFMVIENLIQRRVEYRAHEAIDYDWFDSLGKQIHNTFPGSGYAIILITLVVLYRSFGRERRVESGGFFPPQA